MSRLNKDMDYAGMNALAKAKMIAVGRRNQETTLEMVAQAILITSPNIVTDVLEGMGVDFSGIAAKIANQIVDDPVKKEEKQISKAFTPIPKNSQLIFEMSKKAREIRDEMGNARLGVHHLALAIVQISPSIKELFEKEGVDLKKFATLMIQETRNVAKTEIPNPPKKSPKASAPPTSPSPPPGQFEAVGGLKKGVTPKKAGDVLSRYAVDLTAKAQAKQLDPVIGRDAEINRVFTVLCRKIKNNALLIGEHGVGKTAIVEGIAQRIFEKKAPKKLINKRIFMIDMASIVAGTQYRGQFEERIKSVMEAFEQSNGEYIAFIDEIHTLLGAGSAVGTMDAANILKPSLARGLFRCIGSTTEDEYKKFFKKDGALDRRFQFIPINEPSKEETLSILNGLRPGLENFHKCTVSEEAIKASVEYADLHMPGRHFPDKAIDILDEMCSTYSDASGALSKMHAAKTVSVLTQIPLEIIMHSEYERVAHIKDAMEKCIFGQDRALDAISQALKRSYAGLRDQKRPLASLFFAGPTGVGKTYVAEKLAETIFGSEDSLIKLNMTEFSEKHTVTRLIGSPPSYVGYGERNQFIDRVLRNPHCLILLDEIEKAHEDVVKVFMDVLLNGSITDAEGRKVSFRNAIIIMTTNSGFSGGQSVSALGFGEENSKGDYEKDKERAISLCSSQFGMEFSNRIDEMIVFTPLDEDNLAKVAKATIDLLAKRMNSLNIKLDFNKSIYGQIVKFSKEEHGQNASRIKRFIRNKIEPVISEGVMKSNASGGSVTLSISNTGEIKAVRRKT